MSRQAGPLTHAEDWNFFSFPVFAGVVGGMLLACILFFVVPFWILFLICLGLSSFAASHIIITGTKIRSQRKKQALEEEDVLERRILAKREAGDTAGTSSRRARRRRGK